MLELINTALSGVNLLYSGMLLFSVVYWLSVMIGLINVDTLDIDLDADVSAELHADVDLHAEPELPSLETHIKALGEVNMEAGLPSFLSFFNIGVIPFMIIFSFFSLTAWSLGILTDDFLTGGHFRFDLALILPNFVASLFITSLILRPFRGIFRHINEDNAPRTLVGRTGTLLNALNQGQIGQANIHFDARDSLTQVVGAKDEQLAIGDRIIIVGYSKETNCYLVERL